MRRRPGTARLSTLLVAAAALAAGLMAAPAGPAVAEGSDGGSSTTSGNCTAYATGTGMGSFCAGGGGDAQTLRERFGKQSFDRCRFSRPPKGMNVPFDPTPGEGAWWVRKCINYIDWDTVAGGPGRQLNVHLAYLRNDFDTSYDPSPLSEFLWNAIEASTQFPVPFLQAEPTPVPRVGVPAYFTFRWLGEDLRTPVAQGPYAGEDDGGPYVQIDNNGFLMRARATKIRIDALQKDMDQVICNSPDPAYDAEAGPDPERQESNCFLLFKRSSASARDRMKETDRGIPAALGPVYLVRVAVYWRVQYSRDGQNWTTIQHRNADGGDELIQYTDQPMPVREAQAANVPPRFSLS